MSNPSDGIPKPLPSEMMTGPMSGTGMPTIDEHVATAVTLELHGEPTIQQTALGIARSKIGRYETEGVNWGPFIREVASPFISAERLATYAPGGIRAGRLAWCAFFVCWCILQALKAAGARADHVAIWMRLASGSCTTLYERLDKLGLVTRHVPGEPIPEGTCFLFFGDDTDDGPEMQHISLYDRTAGALAYDISGNSGRAVDGVDDNAHLIASDKIHSTARLPF